MKIIEFKDVWQMYRLKFIIDGKASWENFWALREIGFEIKKGETVGIIGENGAGKSTILKLIAGMLKPERGEINVKGRVSGLLELGAGFQSELSGRENLFLNASLFGLTQNQIDAKLDEIVEFAGLGKFINAPVSCYSQGMFVRLAFAIAIHIDPDILLIDDSLAVGDEYFQRKCIKKIFELKEQGKTIILVTHDMNMLIRLCKRAIFLKEGKVVKDDSIDKVIPLYSQMIGAKEGVGILENGPLNIIFNNGKLLLSWKDKLLTPSSGLHTVFRTVNKWYSSLQADWEVKREGENKLIATGKFYQLTLTQVWKFELNDDYEIKLDIELGSMGPFDIQEAEINLMLINEYTNWLTSLEKDKFPAIDHKNKNWQVLFDNNTKDCIGVEAKENTGIAIPSLVFEQSNYDFASRTQILNADYLTNCRVLQFRTLGLDSYLTSQVERFTYFSGKMILNIPKIDNYLKNRKDEFLLSNNKLRLTFDQGQGILSWNGANLTKTEHINTNFYANGRWYSSNQARWELRKKEKNKLIAKGLWPNLPLMQIWEIEIINETSFLWKVNLKVNEEINIEQQRIQFMCSKDYGYWFSDYGTGIFSNDFLEREKDMLQRCIPNGTIGIQSQDNRFPSLLLKFSEELNNFAKIFNSDFYNKARILRIERVESEEDVKFSPGEYLCCAIEVKLDTGRSVFKEKTSNVVQNKQLRFVFDNGKGHIYWNDRELTKRLGLYTSLRSRGRWYDSDSSAIWKIEEQNKDTIKFIGEWLYLPVIQYWQIRLKEEKTIEFDVKLEVGNEIEVDRLQTNLMLSERYSHWVAEKEKGPFPLFKRNVSDDWDCIWLGKKDSKYIGVLKNAGIKYLLPSVTFYPNTLDTNWALNIINSDVYHRGRVLQYRNSTKSRFSKGRYSYFSGKIIIKD